MFMRITWGKVKPGQWNGYEQAYKKATSITKNAKGLQGRYLVQDLDDPDAGFSVTFWDTEENMREYRDNATFKEKVWPLIEPFYVGEYKTTFCKVKSADESGE